MSAGPKSCEIHGESPNAWGCPECLRQLRDEVTALKRERNHWKANHDHLVNVNAALRDPYSAKGYEVVKKLQDTIDFHWETIQRLQRQLIATQRK